MWQSHNTNVMWAKWNFFNVNAGGKDRNGSSDSFGVFFFFGCSSIPPPKAAQTFLKGLPINKKIIRTCFLRHVRKIVTSDRASSCLSAWNNLAPTGQFHEIGYLRIFKKSVKKIQVPLKLDKNKGYFTWRPIYIFYHILLISS